MTDLSMITGGMIKRAITHEDASHNRYVHLLRRLIDRKLHYSELDAFEAITRCNELKRLGENVECEVKDMEILGNALLLSALLLKRGADNAV